MAAPTAPQCHAMTTYYIKAYTEVKGKAPVVNRNKAKMGWSGMLMDFNAVEAKALVDFYLARYNDPDITWFLYNYERLVVEKQDYKETEARRKKNREDTIQRLKEWEERWNKKKS